MYINPTALPYCEHLRKKFTEEELKIIDDIADKVIERTKQRRK